MAILGGGGVSRYPCNSLASARADVIRKEAWSFRRTNSGVRLCWQLEEPNGPKGPRLVLAIGKDGRHEWPERLGLAASHVVLRRRVRGLLAALLRPKMC